MFNVGDKVVYPMHGAGTIDSIDKKNILDEEVEYINISMPGGVKVMVPSNQASKQGLRNIISQNDVEKVFCVLETDETAMSDNWNKRYRDNMDKMKSGDIYEVADVVRNLSFKQKEKDVGAVAGHLLEVRFRQLLQDGGMRTLAVVVLKIQHILSLSFITIKKMILL